MTLISTTMRALGLTTRKGLSALFAMGAMGALGVTPGAAMAAGAAQGASAQPASPLNTLPPELAQAWQATGLPLSSLSLWVQDVNADTPRLALAGEQPRRMASVMKLLTTGTALRTLGPAWSWNTPVALGGPLDAQGVLHGNLHIRASGDPSLDSMRLRETLQAWRDAGLREVRGDVVVDRSIWRLPPHDPAAFDSAPWKPYNAGPDAWLLAHGALTLRWRVAPADDRPNSPLAPQVTLYPALSGVDVDNQVRLSPKAGCGEWREGISPQVVDRADGGRTLVLKGSYPQACGSQTWPLRWPARDGLEHSARVFKAAWGALGGQLSGTVREGAWPVGATPWATVTSPSLSEVIRDINKFSNNVMARQLFLTLGTVGSSGSATAASGAQVESGNLAQARAVVGQHVRQATRSSEGNGPCEAPEALILDNGAGLSRTEGTTAHCMARWVQVMWQDARMPEWLASMPLAGQDGTARKMTAAVGQAHLKTGSLDDVVSIAGVVQTNNGQRHILVAVVNHPKAEQARGALQTLLQWVARAP
jgi:D-alanyl-D-alanine carboxypeptidase/D-alanyl-D-alanine-endopeptidase (penicillin-binding protein 4)